MKQHYRSSWYILFSLLVVGFSPAIQAQNSVSLLYVKNELNEEDWNPIHDQKGWGIVSEIGLANQPFSIVTSYYTTSASNSVPLGNITIDFSADTDELAIGLRRNINLADVNLFIEGGLTSIHTQIHFSNSLNGGGSLTDTGYWLGAGMGIKLSRHISAGILARRPNVSTTSNGISMKLGGDQTLLFISYHLGD
ncbi:hypothetical protein ACFL2V_10890 [Pseudomonadota bacterium]